MRLWPWYACTFIRPFLVDCAETFIGHCDPGSDHPRSPLWSWKVCRSFLKQKGLFTNSDRHKQYIDPDDFIMAMKLNFISQPLCIFGPLFIKLSTGFLLLRIAGTRFFIILISTIMGTLGPNQAPISSANRVSTTDRVYNRLFVYYYLRLY